VSFPSDILGRCVKARVSAAAVRSVEKNGGIDKYLLKSSENLLSAKFKKIKKILKSRNIVSSSDS
jgi:large subunit ribosomal protein L28